jgi:hypothetical protein
MLTRHVEEWRVRTKDPALGLTNGSWGAFGVRESGQGVDVVPSPVSLGCLGEHGLKPIGPTDVRQGTSGVSRTSQHVAVDQVLNLLNGLKIF